MKFNAQFAKANVQHIAGIIIGLTALKITGLRFSKDDRNTKFYSTVAANLAADGFIQWLPFPIIIKNAK